MMISALVRENLLKSGKILLSSKVTKSNILLIITHKLRWKYKVLIGCFKKNARIKYSDLLQRPTHGCLTYTKNKESDSEEKKVKVINITK